MFWADTVTLEVPKSYVTARGCMMFPATTIARCGTQEYFATEVGADIEPDDTGSVVVHREPSEVFRQDAIRSFADRPITLNHVASADTAEAAPIGRVRRPRRLNEHLVADLEVCDRQALHLIRDRGWRMLSCGYTADYEALGKGRARQRNIQGDHVAVLSPDQQGRCGSACQIITDSRRRVTMKRTHDQLGQTEMGSNTEGETGPVVVARVA
jgi:hypothetical protein